MPASNPAASLNHIKPDSGIPFRLYLISSRSRCPEGAGAAMIPVPSGVGVWIATGHTDMRRGMQGLALQCACMVATQCACVAFVVRKFINNFLILLVEPGGIEPPTSSMPLKRSPN